MRLSGVGIGRAQEVVTKQRTKVVIPWAARFYTHAVANVEVRTAGDCSCRACVALLGP